MALKSRLSRRAGPRCPHSWTALTCLAVSTLTVRWRRPACRIPGAGPTTRGPALCATSGTGVRHSQEADPGQCPGQLHGPAPHGGAPGQEAGPDHLQLPGGEGGRAASAAADSRGSKDR